MDMQQLLSEQANCTDLLKCAFNLNDLEIELYRLLSKKGPLRSDEIAEYCKKGPSTVYRSLQKLMSCGMVVRETKHLEGGGYYYLYHPKSHDRLKKDLQTCVNSWKKRVDELMNRFDEEI
ncbi:MAG: hypothetical protein PWQ88_340 [Candidatus Methanomethylophilaceae archaeon]|nr:hypothetical protein [Candidatus Methanomethylophilaceae archaeon]MDI3542289.1 hypothetical protein [Candidatus Methanomethylophilaceae archaeon]HIJ00173.1 ArsR family transcriptional regulator [Candidatus Methanomethylophilaceae archaeon]